jgi:hypothetical protein
MFASNSRYAKVATYTATLADGTQVTAVRPALPDPTPPMGYHVRHQGDRLDLLAARYLADATDFWRLCDANNSMAPDALAARDRIGVPPTDRAA